MKTKERIPIILRFFKDRKEKEEFLKHVFKDMPLKQLTLFDQKSMIDIKLSLDLWEKKEDTIKNYWIEKPNLNLIQILTDLKIVPDLPGDWYYIEEMEYLIEKIFPQLREVIVWTENYDMDGKLLPTPRQILAKDMTTEHIKLLIYDHNYINIFMDNLYFKFFEKELEIRENGKKNRTNY